MDESSPPQAGCSMLERGLTVGSGSNSKPLQQSWTGGPEDRRPPGASWATSNSDKKRPRAGTLKSFPLSGFSRVKKWISLSNQKSACFRTTWSIRLIFNGFLCWDAFLSTCVVESHSNFTTEIKDSHSGSKSHFIVVFFNSKNMLVD